MAWCLVRTGATLKEFIDGGRAKLERPVKEELVTVNLNFV
jgi:hypothetical protein